MTQLPTLHQYFSQLNDYTGSLIEHYDIYELNAGMMNITSDENITINFPAFYVTNLSSVFFDSTSEFFVNLTYISDNLAPLFMNKEPFVGGVVALCFVLSGIVTASWMMFSLLLLSSNTLPNSLILANLFHSVGLTVMLAELTDDLEDQFYSNFSDMQEIQDVLTSSTAVIIVRNISLLLIYISWVDLAIQMTKYERRRKILIIGLLLSVVASCFHFIQGFAYRDMNHHSETFTGLKGIHDTMGLLVITLFNLQVLSYVIKKRKFAFHKRTMALAVFCLVTLSTPYTFTLIDVCSATLRTWSTYVTEFTKLCVSVAVWEWIHTIRSLEVRNERKTVLGRRLSNDSFLSENKVDPDQGNNSGYIMRSINIVQLLGSMRSRIADLIFSRTKKRRFKKAGEEILLFDMVPTFSRHDSFLSERSAVSLVGDYPQFNVDQRFLRNTPSTIQERATPRSRLITPTPNIQEEAEDGDTNDDTGSNDVDINDE